MDIAANVYLPYLHQRGAYSAAQDAVTAQLAREVYLRLPRSQENRLLKEAVQRFFVPPSRSKEVVDNISRQQGLLEIYRRFCLALDMQCNQCPLADETG